MAPPHRSRARVDPKRTFSWPRENQSSTPPDELVAQPINQPHPPPPHLLNPNYTTMAGDHACPVCQATFTRPQHVARHMRSHTGDRPYKCSICTDSFGRSDLLKRHEKKMHSNGQGTSTPNGSGQNKFDSQFSKALKRPHYPYQNSSNTTSASTSGSGSGSGSGMDSVPSLSQHLHKTIRSESGSESDSRSRSRSLSPPRRQGSQEDELLSGDDSEVPTAKYRRLSDPSGASRMDTDSRKSPPLEPRAHMPRPTSYRIPRQDLQVMTSTMHGTESVRVCRVLRNGDHHFIVEYAISAMLEGSRPSSTSSSKTHAMYWPRPPRMYSPPLFGLHLGAHLVGTHVHVRAARIVIAQVKWGRIPVRGVLHPSTFLRDGEEKRSVTIDVRRERPIGEDEKAEDVVMAEVRSSIQGLVVMKTVVIRDGYSRDECTNVNEHNDGVFCTEMDVDYVLGLPRIPLRIEGLAALGETMRFTDVAQRVTMHRMCREVLETNSSVMEVTYRMPNRHYIPVPLDYIGLQNTKARDAEVFCPVDAPSGCISTTVARAG
ncbi:uricase [Ceratobasidium sp. AG-Ba]|nr:uricase [Ceratobasidium sp. AG-Ba]